MDSSLIRAGDNPDVTKERRRANFPVRQLSLFIHGSEQVLRRRKEILDFVESRPEFRQDPPIEFLSREERYERQAKSAVAMTEHATDVIDGSDFFGEGMYYQSLIMGRDLHAMSLHYVMFLPTIQGQTTEEQLDRWLAPTISRALLGTYAQTELGHGTNLSRLETTATYDPEAEQFVLHSPSVSAAKWWPGALGKSATHAVVMAQLHTRGRCHGPHPFIVQLRDPDTHRPMPGVRVGDIGPKLGINGSDNGFLLFDQYRIPRENMLMRHSQVSREGEYLPPRHSKLGYGSMVFVRSVMIRDQAMQLAAAATIATRYSAVRRQGELEPGQGEVQVLDYRTQQWRVLPPVAKALAFLLAASQVRDLYLKVTEQLSEGNLELLPELHALSSGLKSVVSWEVAQGIEQCRLACGGHGYSQASGLPEIYAYAVGGCTYEGENIVMLLQVARQLVKAVHKVRAGQPLAQIEGYLARKSSGRSSFVDRASLTAAVASEAFEHVARQQVFSTCARLEQLSRSQSEAAAFNHCSVEFCRASRWHVKAYLVRNMFAQAERCQGPESVRAVLRDLAQLYTLEQVCAGMELFVLDGFFSDAQRLAARRGVEELLERLRPNAVAIVDAFDFSDRELHSVLGRRDGNVYPALLEWAQQSQLNRTDVLPAYKKHLGPMLREGRAKL